MSNTKTVKALNEILTYLQDSYQGFSECQKDVKSAQLKSWFANLSEQRKVMIDTLQTMVRAAGTSPTESGSMLGSLHRLYVDLKSLVTKGKNEEVIKEVKRGENILIEHYDKVLKDNEVDETAKTTLRHQLTEIREAYAKLAQNYSVSAA